MERSNDWASTLYNGLVTPQGAPSKVSSGMITKPNHEKQLSERMAPILEVMSNNTRNRGLHRKSKQKFSVHRSLSFLPQE